MVTVATTLMIPAQPVLADQLSAREIFRSPEVRCSDPAPGEARERSLVDSPPFLPALSISPSFLLRLHFRRFMIGLNVPVLVKCETDKSEYHQDGSGDHQRMRILHRGEPLFLRLQPRLFRADGAFSLNHFSGSPIV